MKQSTPACFYHPTTVLFLDDNKVFLNSLELEFGDKKGTLTCADPVDARHILDQSDEDINHVVLHTLDDSEVDTVTNHLVDIKINNIHKLIYDAARFKYISVLVVDYQMPEMNGIDFCKTIKNHPACKIMLTAEADKDIAIEALNADIIDKFLLKRGNSLHEDILRAIDEMKERYFQQLSQTIIDNLGKNFKLFLKSSDFKELFDKVRLEYGAVEYYLVDSHGSFLFLDEKGKPTWLIIRSNTEMNEQVSVLEGLGAPSTIIEQLKNREKLLFMLSERDYEKSAEQWGNYLFKASKLNDNHFYCIVQDQITDAIAWNEIKSYF